MFRKPPIKPKPKPKPTKTVSRPDDQLEAKLAKDWLWPGENDGEISMVRKMMMMRMMAMMMMMMMMTWPSLFCSLG